MRDIHEFETALALLEELRSTYLDASKLLKPRQSSVGHFISNALMVTVCKHTNAMMSVAMIPEIGSHIESAWSIMRPQYEAAVTATSLIQSDDPDVQEERCLLYCSGELEHLGRMLRDEDAGNPDLPPLAEFKTAGLVRLFKMAASKAGKVGSLKKPSCRQMMRQCGIPDRNYREFYSLASHRIHGGSSSFLNWFEAHFRESDEPDYVAWAIPIQGASWSLGDGGAVVLERHGAPERLLKALRDKRNELSEHLAICSSDDDTTD
jgi:Family of unknown function (DUF5677)